MDAEIFILLRLCVRDVNISRSSRKALELCSEVDIRCKVFSAFNHIVHSR